MLTSAGMTQEQFDATLLAEMQLEVGKAVEETIEGEELADLRFTVEDVSSMPEGTKYYVAGDKFKIEAALKEGDQDVKATYEFNEYGYMTYGLNDVKMTMNIGFELKVTMVTESKVTYTK